MNEEFSKKYYKIGDVAELLGLPQSTLRYWEHEFPQLRPKRNAGGTRHYTSTDIDVLRVIKFLMKDKGLTIEGAREHLRTNRHAVDKRQEIIQRLQNIRNGLAEMLQSLNSRN